MRRLIAPTLSITLLPGTATANVEDAGATGDVASVRMRHLRPYF